MKISNQRQRRRMAVWGSNLQEVLPQAYVYRGRPRPIREGLRKGGNGEVKIVKTADPQQLAEVRRVKELRAREVERLKRSRP